MVLELQKHVDCNTFDKFNGQCQIVKCAKIPCHSYFKDSKPESSSEGREEPPTAGSNAQRICGEVIFF